MKTKYITASAALWLAALIPAACTEESPVTVKDPSLPAPVEYVKEPGFARGADVSWVTSLEKEGTKFYTPGDNPVEKELMKLLREDCGVNSIRLRVWVNPAEGWNSVDDVVLKARRAEALGMRTMIDFHFSDSWADPGKQVIPAAWAGLEMPELCKAVGEHVTEVLTALKNAGVTPEWVQIGNETSPGMMHPVGTLDRPEDLTALNNAGYDAAKAVFPEVICIVHLDSGDNAWRYDRMFDLLEANGGKYDMIGMSLYPEKESTDGGQWSVATDMAKVNTCMANIRAVNSRYGKPVVICEIGFHYTNGKGAATAISTIMNAFKGDNRLQGIFYWEPAIPQGYTGYNKGAFVDGRPTEALSPFTSEN